MIENNQFLSSEEKWVIAMQNDEELKSDIISTLDDYWNSSGQMTGFAHDDFADILYKLECTSSCSECQEIFLDVDISTETGIPLCKQCESSAKKIKEKR